MRPRNCLGTRWARASVGAVVLFLSPLSSALAQVEHITVYADASGSSCSIADLTPALFTLFVLHTNVYHAIAVNLSVTESAGFSATFVEEDIPFYHVGTFRDGVTVVYDECIFSTPFLIGTITYQGYGTSETCSMLDTSGNPNWGEPTPYPITNACTFAWYPAPSAGPLYINPSPECSPPCVVKTESSTWGRVKALYRH